MLVRAIACAVVLAFPVAGHAAVGCPSISVSSIAFGTYDPLSSTPADAAGTITYDCDVTSHITISPIPGSRFMSYGAYGLAYNVYTDAARTIAWGDGTTGTAVVSQPKTPGKSTRTLTMFGRIPAAQDVPPGSYLDTLTVTFNF